MLWYKAWRESRTRFVITAMVLTAFCFFATLSVRQIGPLGRGDVRARIHHLIYSGTAKGSFALLAIFLGLGGLTRERFHRTAIFSLALPVSRGQLLAAQIGVGMLELAVLSFLPAAWVPVLSRLAYQPYPLADALHFTLLWFVCSVVIFAFSYFLSITLEGEYVAAVACYIVLMLQALIASWAPFRSYRLNLMWTMAEFPATPWTRLVTLALIALAFFGLAMWRTAKEDF
jgi:ABC-2 type transport system permease protein